MEPVVNYSGYHDCPCRDCFEIAIGYAQDEPEDEPGPALCHACQDAGCDAAGDSECQCEPDTDDLSTNQDVSHG